MRSMQSFLAVAGTILAPTLLAPPASAAQPPMTPGIVAPREAPWSHCVAVSTIVSFANMVKDQPGTHSFVFDKKLSQSFADEWRRRAGLSSVKVTVIVGVASDQYAVATEFGADGCAITDTRVPDADWNTVINAVKGGGRLSVEFFSATPNGAMTEGWRRSASDTRNRGPGARTFMVPVMHQFSRPRREVT